MQDELENTTFFLAKEIQRAEELSVENSTKNGELHEKYVEISQEKEELRIEFETVHIDLQVQLSSLCVSQMFVEEKTISYNVKWRQEHWFQRKKRYASRAK